MSGCMITTTLWASFCLSNLKPPLKIGNKLSVAAPALPGWQNLAGARTLRIDYRVSGAKQARRISVPATVAGHSLSRNLRQVANHKSVT